jgi:branched-chain amino acid transport system ATP-binding protein
VEVARALSTEPKVLLLDEVMAALNAVEMEEMMSLIRSLKEDGLTIIVVEHHMKAIMSLCERIVVLNFGQLIADGPPAEIARHRDVVRAYLGSEYTE